MNIHTIKKKLSVFLPFDVEFLLQNLMRFEQHNWHMNPLIVFLIEVDWPFLQSSDDEYLLQQHECTKKKIINVPLNIYI